jgi:hypothetical protein
LAVVVPAHGKVLFRLACAIDTAVTVPAILLGVMAGAVILGRAAPQANFATTIAQASAEFVVTGLTPGALNVDAAYAVQAVVAASNIKYGGPDDASGADAWGGFSFEAWDPQPIPTAAPGAANGLLIAGANAATAFNLTGNITGNLSGSVGSVTGNVGGSVGSVVNVSNFIVPPPSTPGTRG